VTPEARQATRKLWKAHPDDDADVREAAASIERGELLSPEASEGFLRWLEGSDDESWRAESE
jgi:HEAT repeat protein